jgi:hydroxymethylpyrimidine/phosphomethylpyrimidine kinase
VLTIAGSDSGGGAGIQADLHTFAALGVHGASALTCITAQNPARVAAIEPCSERILLRQLETVWKGFRPVAAKTGMLYSANLVRVVARFFQQYKTPLVVDPVMVSTSGTRLLKPDAIRILTNELLPLAVLVTPNVPEAEVLLGARLRTPEDLRRAARFLHLRFGCAALVKGGHLKGAREAIDLFFDGKNELLLAAPFLRGRKTHGTGCVYSAAIAAYIGRGHSLVKAVEHAKWFVTKAIAGAKTVAGYDVLALS